MKRSLFALFRTADGRSLARALALLVLVSALFGGVSAGYAAANGADPHCTTAPEGNLPPGHDGLSCCPGMVGGTPLLPPPSNSPFEFQPTQTATAAFLPQFGRWVPPPHLSKSDQPRAPPAQA